MIDWGVDRGTVSTADSYSMDKDLIDFLTKLDHAEDPETVYDVWLKAVNSLGFETINYTYAQQQSDGSMKIAPATNFSDEWMQYYVDQDMQHHDYLMDHVYARRSVPLIHDFDELAEEDTDTSIKRDLWNGAAEFGLKRGMAVAFSDLAGNGFGGVSIGSNTMSSKDFTKVIRRKGTVLFAMAHMAHQRLKGHYMNGERIDNITLSERQRELIKCLAKGLSNKDIGHKLNIKQPTVSFHIKELATKLGVRSTREILPKAILYNLVQF